MNRREVIACLAEIISEVASGADATATAGRLAALIAAITGGGHALESEAPQLQLTTGDGAPIVVAPVPSSAVIVAEVVPDTEVRASETAQSVVRVFAHWQRATGKTRARLLPGRSAKIRARLREFTEAELCIAIDGALLSDFHRGDNDGGTEYLDIRTLFKNGEVVEGHIERAGAVPHAPVIEDNPQAQRIAQLRVSAAEALNEGRTDDYNAYNGELRRLLAEE